MGLSTISVWVLASTLVLTIGRIVYALFLSPYRNVPGPRLCKITGYWIVYHDLLLRRIDKIQEWHQRYGDIVLVAPGEVSFSNPALNKEIYGSTGAHPKSGYFNHFLAYGERAIFCTLGVREHRRILKRTFAFYQPTTIYKPTMLQPIRANVQKLLGQLIRASEIDTTVDVLQYCNFFSFDNITTLLYGPELGAQTIENEKSEDRRILAGWMDVEIWNSLSYNAPLLHRAIRSLVSSATQNADFLTAEDRLAAWCMNKIEAASQRPDDTEYASLYQLLRNAKTPDGEPLSTSWIAAELLDNVNAAQSTVALALMYALWNLAGAPQWQHRIRQELSVMRVEEDGLPAFEEIQTAPILDACTRESSRVNPLSSGRAERVVPTSKTYHGVLLPAGTIVSTSTRSMHHKPDVFPDPQGYRPERWLEADEVTLGAMESCYMPFGYGARLCLGKAFAQAEIKLMIAAIVMTFELRRDAQSETNSWSMEQLGTQNALPRGQRCDLLLSELRPAAPTEKKR